MKGPDFMVGGKEGGGVSGTSVIVGHMGEQGCWVRDSQGQLYG